MDLLILKVAVPGATLLLVWFTVRTLRIALATGRMASRTGSYDRFAHPLRFIADAAGLLAASLAGLALSLVLLFVW